ncbi:MAG TPA: PfkB family carbohydrate kinase [Kiritimatiellia bacterium]|jgi:sugar/nucleoside kinase (ribokinase family)|nr:PfkB family carbohydrate kinase [Kiritimatiellia bacterium]
MNKAATPDVVVVGSVAFDSVQTPKARHEKLLGGSASYTSVAAALFARTGIVGVVGEDFPPEYVEIFERAGVDLQGLQREPGKTFHWSGLYEDNMNNRRTNCTDLNVFADFNPVIPEAYRTSPYLCLENIAPALQARVLDQMEKPRFTVLDTMDLWINTTREELMNVIARVDLLTVNEHEARHLTGKGSLLKAAKKILDMGPKYALIKKGEHGAFLMSQDDILIVPAWPLLEVVDPTGAGDTFAGGLLGTLAELGDVTRENLHKALVNATVTAAFTCEAFSVDRLRQITRAELNERVAAFRRMLP